MRERLDNRYHQTECQRVHECRRNIKLTSDSLHRILRQELKAQYQSGNTYRDNQGQFPTDNIPAAIVGPAAADTDTTKALIPIPRPRKRLG